MLHTDAGGSIGKAKALGGFHPLRKRQLETGSKGIASSSGIKQNSVWTGRAEERIYWAGKIAALSTRFDNYMLHAALVQLLCNLLWRVLSGQESAFFQIGKEIINILQSALQVCGGFIIFNSGHISTDSVWFHQHYIHAGVDGGILNNGRGIDSQLLTPGEQKTACCILAQQRDKASFAA